MSPKPPPVFTRPSLSGAERRIAELEERAEARGNAVAGQATNDASTHPVVKESKLRREERGIRVAGYLPPELEHELRMLCARERRSVSDALTEAVRALIEQHRKSA